MGDSMGDSSAGQGSEIIVTIVTSVMLWPATAWGTAAKDDRRPKASGGDGLIECGRAGAAMAGGRKRGEHG
jgi:hypothetical protein